MKLKNVLLVGTLLLIGAVSAQIPPPAPTEPIEIGENEIVDFPDVDADFQGGPSALKKFIEENITYPQIAMENGDSGRVYIKFIVEKDGSVSNVEVLRGGVSPELNAEAIRIVRMMPEWIPGEVRGKKVRSRCRVPISFTLVEGN